MHQATDKFNIKLLSKAWQVGASCLWFVHRISQRLYFPLPACGMRGGRQRRRVAARWIFAACLTSPRTIQSKHPASARVGGRWGAGTGRGMPPPPHGPASQLSSTGTWWNERSSTEFGSGVVYACAHTHRLTWRSWSLFMWRSRTNRIAITPSFFFVFLLKQGRKGQDKGHSREMYE